MTVKALTWRRILDKWDQAPNLGLAALVLKLGRDCVKAMWDLIELFLNRTWGGHSINNPLWTRRGMDEFPSVVFVTPIFYCKTEMILFLWQLCVNVLHRVFLHFMPRACSVYQCLLSDWGYCTVSLLSIYWLITGWNMKPGQEKRGNAVALGHWCHGNTKKWKDNPYFL